MLFFCQLVLAVVAGNLLYDIGNDIFDNLLGRSDEDGQ